MNIELTEKQIEKLKIVIQKSIDSELNRLRTESQEWGLGEMDEIYEIESVDKIIIDRIVTYTKIKVYIDIYSNSDRDDFDNLRGSLQYTLSQIIPMIEIYINQIN
jgi:hypothetical protein